MPLETGGGIFKALPLLGPGPFLVVNGDTWSDVEYGRLALEDGANGRIVLVPNPTHHTRGDFGIEGDVVVDRDVDRFTYSGVGVYRPEFFAGCSPGKFPMLPLLKRAIAARLLRGEVHRGEWCDVGRTTHVDGSLHTDELPLGGFVALGCRSVRGYFRGLRSPIPERFPYGWMWSTRTRFVRAPTG